MVYQVVSALPSYCSVTLPVPFKLGKGEIRDLTLAQADVVMGNGAGQAAGRGAVFFSPVWAYGLDKLEETEKYMRTALAGACIEVAGKQFPDPLSAYRTFSTPPSETAPLVYRNACAPLDSAIWDAVAKLEKKPAYDLSFPLELYLGSSVAGQTTTSYFRRPVPSLPILHTVGGGDAALDSAAKAIREEGVRAFKVKTGRDPEEAAARVRAVAELAADLAGEYELTVDANETMDGGDVSRFCRYAARHPSYERILFLEQPVSRHNHESLHLAARLPLVADEGVASHTDLPLYAARGWKGVALKPTAKGHTETILTAVRAAEYGMFTTVQDLTNPPPYALRHHLLFAASLAGLAGPVEYNSRQFLSPSLFESSPWDFSVRDGRVAVPPGSAGLY